MVSVAVSLPVRIVLIQKKFFSAACLGQGPQAVSQHAFAGPLKDHELARVGAFRSGIFWMRTVDVQPPAVGEQLVQQAVVFGTPPFPLAFHLKPPDIQQRVLVFIVPDRLRGWERGTVSNQLERIGDRIERLRVTSGAAALGTRSYHPLHHYLS